MTIEQVIFQRLDNSIVGNSTNVYQLTAGETDAEIPLTIFGITYTKSGEAQRGRNRLRQSNLEVAVVHTTMKSAAQVREQVIETLDGWCDLDNNVNRCRWISSEPVEVVIEDNVLYQESIQFDLVYGVDPLGNGPAFNNAFANAFNS